MAGLSSGGRRSSRTAEGSLGDDGRGRLIVDLLVADPVSCLRSGSLLFRFLLIFIVTGGGAFRTLLLLLLFAACLRISILISVLSLIAESIVDRVGRLGCGRICLRIGGESVRSEVATGGGALG
jgi:hypothetical protein